jgi:hypothetical protein
LIKLENMHLVVPDHPNVQIHSRLVAPPLRSVQDAAPTYAIALRDHGAIPCTPVADGDLMGVVEISRRLGVSKSRARQITAARGFPAPYARLTMGVIWRTKDVEAWIARYRPEPA